MLFARAHIVVVTIALAAMMLRALMPAGWMPAAQAQGTGFVICTVHGALRIDGGAHKPAQRSSHGECPFSSAPQLSGPEVPAAIPLPSVALASRDLFIVRLATTHAPDHVLKTPRAPPLPPKAFATPTRGGTTGTINPGILWSGQYVQLGVEAVIPFNGATGHNVGFTAQLHFYMDDIFPNSLGRPLFGE